MASVVPGRGIVVAGLLLIAASGWSADTATRCCAKRLRPSGQSERRIFRCHAAAAAHGTVVDAGCVAAAGDALTRTFARTGCPAPSDAALVRADLERIVAAAATALRPTVAASKCAAGKLKAAGRLVATAARAFAREAPRPADRLAELDPVVTALLGDLRTAFARLESQGPCLTAHDADAIWSRLMAGDAPPVPPDGTLLVSLRLCPACGDSARGGVEQCDGLDALQCNGPCRPDCTCPTCGDGVKNQTTEACDGADAAACQGLCLPDCTCPPPVCGNGIKETGEDCDGPGALGACGSSCNPDCTCGPAVCGNGIVEPPEQCEGTVCYYAGGLGATECRPDSCTCCGYPCYVFGCCDPEETCMPSPSTGYCFKFACNQSPRCDRGFECIDTPGFPEPTGKVCAGSPGNPCFLPNFTGGVILPCVPPGVCLGGVCCLQGGEGCSDARSCCSGTCTAGTCS